MAKRIMAYECEYCGDIKRTKNICERHERACVKNPEGQNCLRCIYSTTDSPDHLNRRWCLKLKTNCTTAISADCEHYTQSKTEGILDKLSDVLGE